MRTGSTRTRLLASSMICGAAMLVAGQAAAQDAGSTTAITPVTPASATPASAPQDELVVTGSRIPTPNLTSVSPVTAITNAEVKFEGATRVEDLLNNLPQAFADQGSTVSNGSSGTATVDLRGLGAQRTLVLIDGRRLMPGDARNPVADLNFIPAQLIDRVDVVTGGASAVYGADAVAGVVNFIMLKNFEGVRLDAQYSTFQHHNDNDTVSNLVRNRGFDTPSADVWDGATVDVTGVIGVNSPDGRGNATVYATYRHTDAVTQAKRDYSACSLAPSSTSASGLACGGSGTSNPARFLSYDLYNANMPYDLSFQSTGTRPFSSSTDAFNYAPYNYYQRNDERYTFGAMAHYEINKAADVYTQLMFMDDHTNAVIAPSGVFGQTVSIPCSSPLLSADQVNAICTSAGLGANDTATGALFRRNTEGGGRNDDIRHTDYRIVAGVRGDLGHGWNYDVYGQYSAAILNETYQNDFSVARTLEALNVTTDASGNAICASASARAAGCVPYNIFTPGGVTQEALDYLQTPGLSSGTTTEQIVSGNITGDLGQYGLKSPFANDGVGVSVGAEYRRETLDYRVDTEFSTGDLAGQGGATLGNSGAFDVSEAFGEVRIPIVQDVPFIHELSFEGGYRYSDYSTGVTTSTYKLAGNWAPTEDIRFRGSYNRAVRAPNINELFTASSVGLGLSDDPCTSAAGADGLQHPEFTAAQCANTGVTANQYGRVPYNSSNQYNALLGGNTDLQPEVADTYTAGLVLTPRFLPGFNLTLDYFDIKVNNTISALSPDLVLRDCALSGDATLCGLVHRAANGSLYTGGGYVEGQAINIGYVKTTGVDVSFNYRLPFSSWGMDRFGGLDVSLVGTWLDKLETDPGLPALNAAGETVATSYNCKGYFAAPYCGTPNPEWRHRLRLTWNTPKTGLAISGSWRFISQVTNAGYSDNAYLNSTVAAADARIPSQSYFDLAATWRVRDSYTLRVGVNNVLDRDPPLVTSTAGGTDVRFNGNTYPGVYDALGRYMFVGVTADF